MLAGQFEQIYLELVPETGDDLDLTINGSLFSSTSWCGLLFLNTI